MCGLSGCSICGRLGLVFDDPLFEIAEHVLDLAVLAIEDLVLWGMDFAIGF